MANASAYLAKKPMSNANGSSRYPSLAYREQSTYRKHVGTSRNVHVCHTIGYELHTPLTYVHVEKYVHRTIVYEKRTGRDVHRLYQDIVALGVAPIDQKFFSPYPPSPCGTWRFSIGRREGAYDDHTHRSCVAPCVGSRDRMEH